ncbi:TetR/AcrR family transcriptional regulator [Microlunatus lacustris]
MNHSYHHGNLHAAVLEQAAVVIAAEGPHTLSLRSLAADLGVSHTAPRHHFGSREGVLNALAAQGFNWLADRLAAVREDGGGFLDLGVAYVEFAVEHPAHFQVMFTPSLLDESHPELSAARRRTFAELTGGADRMVAAQRTDDAAAAIIAGWSLVHGLATLALSGNLDSAGVRELLAEQDLSSITRRMAGMLFASSRPDGTPPTVPADADATEA